MDDKRVIGFSGCNRFFCDYVAEGETLSFGPVGSTLIACPDDIMAVEDMFMKILGHVTAWTVDRGVLHLIDGPGRASLRSTPAEKND